MIKTYKYGNKKSIAYLNGVIKRFIEKIYGPYGFVYPSDRSNIQNYDIKVGDQIINTEYIGKMVNNYTVFKAVIRINNLRDEDSFYNFMMNNLNEIYHFSGRFFKEQTLPILINTTRRGNVIEQKSKEAFDEYAQSRGINIVTSNPTIEEDVRGIDFKFQHNGKTFTVQVKPFTKYKVDDDNVWVKSNGSLSVDTHYLILSDMKNFIILKNPKNDPIQIKGDVFQTTRKNLLQII